MCGRYVNARTDVELVRNFGVQETYGDSLPRSWNVAPTTSVRIIAERLEEDGQAQRQLRTARWGLVPSWSKQISGAPLINARVETVTSKPSFRKAALVRRCVVPAEGYYEWMPTGGKKQAYYLHDPDQAVLGFAGLFEWWRDPATGHDGPWLWSTTIITTAAPDALGHIHDRTPLIVGNEHLDDWLDPATTNRSDVDQLLDVLLAQEPALAARAVAARVGSVRNNDADLITPIGD